MLIIIDVINFIDLQDRFAVDDKHNIIFLFLVDITFIENIYV